MLTSSEVEDEVDHSFFDSDNDDGSVSREGGETRENPPVQEKLQAKQTEKANNGLSQRTYGTKKHLQKINNNRSSGGSKENSHLSKEENNRRVSNVSSVASVSDKGISDSSDSEEDYNVLSKRPNKTFMSLLDEVKDRDLYNQSPDETEEEASGSNAKPLKWRNTQSSKKLTRKLPSQSPSPSSAEEADSESGSSCSCRRSSTPHKPMKSSLSPRERQSTEGGAGSRDMTTSCAEESDDTVTDVSPLSSPDISPLQSLDLNHTEPEEQSSKEQQQESVPSSGLSDTCQYEDSDQDVDDCSLSSDSQLGGGLVVCYPGQKNRKNFSFNNIDVRRIDQENQRLLRALSRLSAEPRPQSAAKKKTNKGSNSPAVRLNYSAVNRQRDQKRIERENLVFLKRLESAKPSSGMKRSEQLADYQRLESYLGGPVYPMWPSSKKDRSSCRTNSVGPRSASSTNHSSRAVSTTTDSGSTPAPTSNKRCSNQSRFQT
ncbi:cilia- and flagella-associated protein 97 isoform X2 [Hippoglossus hippoglossus]|nr:cilia- and flagella-associated protein 97 isoform X2 [Hippoglossus hippoglossus]